MTVDHQQLADLRRRRAARILNFGTGTGFGRARPRQRILAAIKTEMIKLAVG